MTRAERLIAIREARIRYRDLLDSFHDKPYDADRSEISYACMRLRDLEAAEHLEQQLANERD